MKRESIHDIIAACVLAKCSEGRMVMDGALDRLVEVHRVTPTCWARTKSEAGYLKYKAVYEAAQRECRHPDCYPPLVLP